MSRKEYQKRWRARNRDKCNQYSREWYRRNKKKAYAATKRWVKLNPKKVRAAWKRWRDKLRTRVLEKLGNKCANKSCQWQNRDGSRGCKDSRCLQIDHIQGGGTQENLELSRPQFYTKVLNDTLGLYQLLCANCNWIKRHTNQECN